MEVRMQKIRAGSGISNKLQARCELNAVREEEVVQAWVLTVSSSQCGDVH